MPQRDADRLDAIDVFRAAAILAVFAFHAYGCAYGTDPAAAPDAPPLGLLPLTWGWAGVSLFFVLSGFVIHRGTLRAAAFDPAGFFARRFWRIYPAYLAALVFFALFTRTDPLSWAFVSHLALVHNFDADTFFAINPSFWSLAVEAQLYLLYPAFLALRRRLGVRGAVAVLFAVSAACRTAVPLLFRPGSAACGVAEVFPLCVWWDWALGAWLAEAHARRERVLPRSVLVPVALGALFVLAAEWGPLSGWRYGFAALFALAVVERGLGSPMPAVVVAALAPVGRWSYSLYLWHQPLLGAAAGALSLRGGPLLLILLGSLPLFLAWSALAYRAVEVPFTGLGRRRPRPASGTAAGR